MTMTRFGLMQADGHAHLFEDEILFRSRCAGSEGLGSSGNDDHVGALDTLFLRNFRTAVLMR